MTYTFPLTSCKKKQLNIGIDIDGVINDLERFHIDYGTRFCYENNLPCYPNYFEYKLKKLYNWNEKFYEKFCQEYSHILFLENQYFRFMAADIIKILSADYQIFIITARPDYLVNYLQLQGGSTTFSFTKKWLQEQKIFFDQLILSSPDKRDVIKLYNIDIMIEDNPEFLELVRNDHRFSVLCYHANYNKHIEGENITRVHSWHDILYKIRLIEST